MMSDVFNSTIKSLSEKNLRSAFLINKSQDLPFCKRNILEAKIVFWDWIYSELVQRILLKVENPIRAIDINNKCKQYLLENRLANPKFLEFFFAFHQPLTSAFLMVLQHELGNGHPIEEKIRLIGHELTELLNVARIELEGMRISCETFGCTPMCPAFKGGGKSECETYGMDEVFTLLINPEYYLQEGLFDDILKSLSMIKESDRIIMIVDYRNLCSRESCYNWDSEGAYQRYLHCKKYVKEIYFYKYETCVDFGNHAKELKKFCIPNKVAHKKLCSMWKKDRQLIYF